MTVGLLAALAGVIDERGDAPAIEDRGCVVSYAQLWAWAGAIAAELTERGVGRGDRVALELGKSADYVAAMFGCWWVGAAFIATPTELPSERRRVILGEARPDLRLDAELVATLRHTRAGVRFGPVTLAPDDLAYIFYTSGSSGRPKGVRIAHRGLVPLFAGQCAAFELGPRSRSLAYLSFGFDASISDIGTALYAGATLVIVDACELATPARLLACLAAAQISYADLPPALLGHLDPSQLPACLETVVIGGEVCPAAVVRRFAARIRLISVYGPTEATVCASTIRCGPDWDRPLLGAPLPGWSFHVVDGELWIAGVGLGLGYVARRDGSDPDPGRFVERAGQRMVRTGDRVTLTADGELEFVGRLDRQRKIAGVRIELDELEAWLVEHPGVIEAAIVELEPGQLLACFVTSSDASDRPNAASLREHLRERVPGAAVPRGFVEFDALPRGPTGKLDRARLQLEVQTRTTAPTTTDPDPDPLTARLGGLWRRILALDRLDPDARFTDLGGHSLAALELVANAQAYGITLSAATLLANPSFTELLAAARAAVTDVRSTAQLRLDVAGLIARAPDINATRCSEQLAPDATLLVTGATGFLGRHLIRALRRRHRGRILALVRGRDLAHAQAHLDRALGPGHTPIDAVVGDLAADQLGLEPAIWTALADQLDAIVHLGACVNLGLGFDALRPVNLDGTARVLALALAGRPKQLHAISSLSVFVAATPTELDPSEDHPLPEPAMIHGGYAQSKWAAEHLVRERARGRLATAIHRLGLITGDRVDGHGPERDQLGMVIRGLVELGAIPAGHDPLRFDVTPVDYAAESLAELILAGPPLTTDAPTTWQLASPHGASAADLLAAIRRSGAAIEQVDHATWQRIGQRLAQRSSQAAIAYLAFGRCCEPESFEPLRAYDLFQATGFTFTSPRTTARLDPVGLACPPASPELLDRYVHAARGATP